MFSLYSLLKILLVYTIYSYSSLSRFPYLAPLLSLKDHSCLSLLNFHQSLKLLYLSALLQFFVHLFIVYLNRDIYQLVHLQRTSQLGPTASFTVGLYGRSLMDRHHPAKVLCVAFMLVRIQSVVPLPLSLLRTHLDSTH